MITEGTTASISFTVDDASTAEALGSGDVAVLGTPKVIALCEAAAVAATVGELPDGSTTVGVHISMDHMLPTAVGVTVEATAVVVASSERRIEFDVTAHDGDHVIASGTHARVVVDKARFIDKNT